MNSATRLLGGRYQVGALIGRGGMAEVHAGHDTRLGRTVAIKMLRSDLARDPAFLARFRREAQSAAGLNHPAIVAVYDSGEDEDTESGGATVALPYIVMEYVEGRTLREILNETTVMEPDEAARVTEGVLDALSYSHRMGIVHRDIKPANVMLTPAGTVKVMDFGIARAIADTAATMTQTQSVVGTAQYLSPEQAQGNPVDARSDLYSTGCLLYELLTGRTPFVGDSPVSIAYQHVGQVPQPPSVYQHDLSRDLDAVVLHSLAKDRDERYQDATSFRSDLSAARGGRPISSAALGTAAGLAGVAGATMAMGQADRTQVVTTPPGLQHNTASLPAVGHDPAAEPPKRHKTTYVLLAIAVIAALVLLGLAGKAMFGSTTPATFAVPRVTNLTQEAAVASLKSAGFVAKVTEATSPTKKGTVFDQSPTAGTREPKTTVVTISVSSGPGDVTVPDVTGFDQASADAQLKTSGLVIGGVELVDNSKLAKGKVIETNPPGGATVAAGSAVTERVSSGKVKVPSVLGLQQGEAQNLLADVNLKYSIKFKDSLAPQGTVLEQTPKGSVVDVGTEIVLTVANAAQTTAPPPPPTTTTPPPTPTSTPSTPPPNN